MPKKTNTFEHQLDSFIDHIAGSIYWKDKDGVYLGCNTAVLEKGGLKSKADIINKTDQDVWPAQADEIRKADCEVMLLNKIIEKEEAILLKNGQQLYFSSIKAPLKDEHNNIVGVIGNSLDITELKQAQKNAEIANQAKTQFLALMSHELRIPLAGIISSASILADDDMPLAEVQRFAGIIQSSAQYLLSTLDNVLDFAKLEANKFEAVAAPVNLHTILNEVVAILSITAREKGLEVFMSYDAKLPEDMIADSRIIRHILNNLISNAIKYTEKGHISIQVEPISHHLNSIKLKISVSDTGIGIPSDKLDFIFDKFSQIENTYVRKQSRSGSGLGLSIVKKLIDVMNGKVGVISELGKGSTFYVIIELPLIGTTNIYNY